MLIVSIAVLIAGILVFMNYNSIYNQTNMMLMRFGPNVARVMTIGLFVIGFAVFVWALYVLFDWARTGTTTNPWDDVQSIIDQSNENAVITESQLRGDAINPENEHSKSNLAMQTSKMAVIQSGVQTGTPELSIMPDNLLEKLYLPDVLANSLGRCNRTIKSGSCTGVSRLFRSGDYINECPKLSVVAPHKIPYWGNVNFIP